MAIVAVDAEGKRMQRRGAGLLRASASIVAATLLAAAALADNASTQPGPVETSATRETVPSAADSRATEPSTAAPAGVRAFVDPETGRLTANPTQAQLQRAPVERRATTLSRSTTGLRTFELSRGGQGLNLQGRFQTAVRVERQPDGSFKTTCGHGEVMANGHTHEGTPVR